MISAKAIVGGSEKFFAEVEHDSQDFSKLLKQKWIACVDNSGCICDDSNFYQVTKAGMSAVSFSQKYTKKGCILNYTSDPAPSMTHMTVIDLIMQLKPHGWQVSLLENKRTCAPYIAGRDKIIYCYRGGGLGTDYLKALLSSDKLIQEGGCSHYFQSNAYYKALLGLPVRIAVCLQPDMSAAHYKKQLRQDPNSFTKEGKRKALNPSAPPGLFNFDDEAGLFEGVSVSVCSVCSVLALMLFVVICRLLNDYIMILKPLLVLVLRSRGKQRL